MLVQLIPLLCLLQAGDVQPAASLRDGRLVGIWIAPLVTRQTLLPIGAQVGLQLGRRFLLTASFASLPVENIGASQWSIGGRWYLGDGWASPFIAVEGGSLSQEIDDTGGIVENYEFGVGGLGVELLSRYGFSLSTDLQVGPEHRDGHHADETWLFEARYRLGLGFHF